MTSIGASSPAQSVQSKGIDMPHHYAQLTCTESVKAAQRHYGTHLHNARRAASEGPGGKLSPREIDFIAVRDSFYMATVSDSDWPYVQHRGGDHGFLRVLDPKTLAFPDFRGNLQYLSVGNLSHNNRVSLILVDYPNRRRLKILGHARTIDAAEVGASAPALLGLLQADEAAGSAKKVERVMLIDVDAYDWNCAQHITPRFTEQEIEPRLHALQQRTVQLEAQLRALGIEPQ